MNYDLALRLKNAGFPQPNFEQNKHLSWQAEAPQGHANFQETLVYCPTLSELIEACGKKRKSQIGTEGKFVLWFNRNDWCAGYFIYGNNLYIDDYPEHKEGSTPEEAVANLWLALNEK